MEKGFYKCDLCCYRDDPKDEAPCALCSDNKNYISRYKEHPVATSCKEIFNIKDNFFNNSDPEGETVWTATKS